ncbi:MAG: DUF4351 domain-containing protein [Cyanobacteria bacterium P01_E01_bin.42]
MEEGIEIGFERGLEEGIRQGKIDIITHQISRKIGKLESPIKKKISDLKMSQLEVLGVALLSWESSEGLLNWLEKIEKIEEIEGNDANP